MKILNALLFSLAAWAKPRHSEKVQAMLDKVSDDFDNTRINTKYDDNYAAELPQLELRMEAHVIEGGIYKTYGSAVFLYDSVKLLPQTWGTQGALFMEKPIVTPSFTTSLKMNLKNLPTSGEEGVISGMAVWHLEDKQNFPQSFGPLFGFQDSWNGVGIFVFHDGSNPEKSVWRLTVIENFGTARYTEDHIREASDEKNSCVMDFVNTGTGKFFLKIHVLRKKMSINYGKRNSNLKLCLENLLVNNWNIKGFMGITARNPTRKLDLGK